MMRPSFIAFDALDSDDDDLLFVSLFVLSKPKSPNGFFF